MSKLLKPQRDAKFELLRIVSMCMILGLHYYSFGVYTSSAETLSANLLIMRFFYTLNYGCVNLFVLITGWFWSKNSHPVKKSVVLCLTVAFYSYLILFISFILKEAPPFNADIIKYFLPVSARKYWFISDYVGLLLLTPMLNFVIEKLPKKIHFSILAFVAVFVCMFSTVLPASFTLDSTGGYSLFWFICLYFLGAYLNKYKPLCRLTKMQCLSAALIVAGVTFCVGAAFSFIHEKTGIDDYWGLMYAYNSLPIVIMSVFIFEFFNKLQIKSVQLSMVINYISPLVLAVYLIHLTSVFHRRLYTQWFNQSQYQNSPLLIVQYFAFIAAVFTGCVLIELIRSKIFGGINIKIASWVEDFALKIYDKICKRLCPEEKSLKNGDA